MNFGNLDPIKISNIRAINDDVLVTGMDFGERVMKSGIVLRSDDGQTHGIRPRWAKVLAIGPEQNEVSVGQWILVEHGRWTRVLYIEDTDGVHSLQKVDLEAIMCVSDTQPNDEYITPVNY